MKSSYKEMLSFKNKVVVITGGTGILGKRFCRGFAELGANLGVVDLDEGVASDFASQLEIEYGVKAIGIGCNISDPESVSSMVLRIVDKLESIDVLINNAASKSDNLDAFFAPFEEYSLDEWRKVMSVNIDGAFLVAQSVGKQMIKQGRGGSIIQTSSIYGSLAPDKRIYQGSYYLGREINSPAVYTASKAAVVGMSKYLSAYWADKGIRVNTISPGGVQSGQNTEFINRYSQRIPLGRMAEADEIVGAVLFLASDAASYVTGQNVFVDGGLSAW